MDHNGSRNTFKRLVRGRGSDIKLGRSEGKPAAIILTRDAARRCLLSAGGACSGAVPAGSPALALAFPRRKRGVSYRKLYTK